MARVSTSVRFTINSGGKPRCFLSVAENSSTGDLILNLYNKQFMGGVPDLFGELPEPERGRGVKEYRYTVHASPNSQARINTIKLHLDYEDGEQETFVQHTTAIKQNSTFAPIHARRCSTMDDERYDLRPGKGPRVHLGEMQTGFTLTFAVFIGSPGSSFNFLPAASHVREVAFREFNLVLVWSFLTVVSTDFGGFIHVLGGTPSKIVNGKEPFECAILFDGYRDQLKGQVVDLLCLEMPEFETMNRAGLIGGSNS